MSMKQQYGQPKDNYHAKIIAKSAGIFIVCVILTLLCLVPIYILIVNSTHAHMDLAQNPSRFWFGKSLADNFRTLQMPDMSSDYYRELIERHRERVGIDTASDSGEWYIFSDLDLNNDRKCCYIDRDTGNCIIYWLE